MEKTQALASLGQQRLLLPAWVKAALAANDRLKLCLTLLQAACAHADAPEREPADLSREIAAARLPAAWLEPMVRSARRIDGELVLPELPRLAALLADDLAAMARPVLETALADDAVHARVAHWHARLGELHPERLDEATLAELTHGRADGPDSLHRLVMDLHKRINRLATSIASEVVAGADCWDLQPEDRPRVAAFMRGLNRTRALKFDHPGLDTASTRDGERLLIQNDIGTNDAHVLVLQVQGRSITLTYSDLHRARLAFFQAQLVPFGAQWSSPQARVDEGLNAGDAYTVATARFDCADDAALDAALAGIGSRIVFLIDWNRARKRLQLFVDKPAALAVLAEAARQDVGHRAWLQAGGEQLVFGAMQLAVDGAFRVGDRLDEVLGAADARAFLLALLRAARDALQQGQPPALVADQARLLLARQVRQRSREFDLLAEQAAWCQALAQGVADALAHGAERSRDDAARLVARAKRWEREADRLVVRAREQAERLPRWRPVARLVEQADDVADALEEAAFLIGLVAERADSGWTEALRRAIGGLADTVLEATQDRVRAVELARSLGAGPADGPPGTAAEAGGDNDAFLAATWRVLQAERQCDALLRDARRVMLATITDAAALMLASDLAATLELASDRLLTAAYALRDRVLDEAGSPR